MLGMSMREKLPALWPEIVLFVAACVVMVVGLSRDAKIRNLCLPLCLGALGLAGILAWTTTPAMDVALPGLAKFGKVLAAGVGALLLVLLSGTADREYEAAIARGTDRYDPLRASRAEFYAFFLFSITGLMLCAGADDLILLFLALELTSLPTYIMVSISTRHGRSMEAGVKYFFLGALGAAIFLYGFTLIYGGTGSTNLAQIHRVLAGQVAAAGSPSGINAIAMAGLVLSVIGVGFKIAAVPMHFYTPDVYQGASSSVAAFLAFVPKTAGFLTILLLCASVGWVAAGHPDDKFGSLPSPLHETLWIMAALTMTVGNVLAVIQTSVKRVLAYSSIAHSGYMLVGVVAGPGDGFASSGIAAVLFYLVTYGVINVGAFAVLASLERVGSDGKPEEIDSFDDLRGLCRTRPLLGYTLVLSSLGLLGLPLTLGFWAKLPLFTSALASGETVLVLILAVNSAIAAYYYLGLARAAWLDVAEQAPGAVPARVTPFLGRILAGVVSAGCVIVLAIVGAGLMTWAKDAAEYRFRIAPPPAASIEPGVGPAGAAAVGGETGTGTHAPKGL